MIFMKIDVCYHGSMVPTQGHSDPRPGQSGRLAVGEGHVLHWEATGAAAGIPALVLHGGPGSASSPVLRQCFDLARFRVITFDQRGCGLSTPRGAIAHNDTGRLVQDIERLRAHLGCSSWFVVGGSWGATLALTYAARYPQSVRGLLLRNLFVPSPTEIAWFFQGAAALHPCEWHGLAELAPAGMRPRLLPWLAGVFAADNHAMQARAAGAWLAWEHALAGLPPPAAPQDEALQRLIHRYRVQAHYLAHGCWVDPAEWSGVVLSGPVQFLHGRHDVVCRPAAAREVQHRVPGSTFIEVAAGHDPFEPAMAARMREALEHLATDARCCSHAAV